MRHMLKNLVTGIDGQTHDIGRVSWASCHLGVMAATIWNGWHEGAIDLVKFAEAHAAVVGIHGASLWAKKDTEPKPPDPPKESP